MEGEEAGQQGKGGGLTGHEVTEADGGDCDEGVVEALDVVPLLGHHEHKGWDDQVNQDAPQDEDGCAGDLRLPLMGRQETRSDGAKSETQQGHPEGWEAARSGPLGTKLRKRGKDAPSPTPGVGGGAETAICPNTPVQFLGSSSPPPVTVPRPLPST